MFFIDSRGDSFEFVSEYSVVIDHFLLLGFYNIQITVLIIIINY